MTLIAGVNDHGRRLDRVLRKALPKCPLPFIHKLLRKKAILVNGKPATPQTRIVKGSIIKIPRLSPIKRVNLPNQIDIPIQQPVQPQPPSTPPQALPPQPTAQPLPQPTPQPTQTPQPIPQPPTPQVPPPQAPQPQKAPAPLSVKFFHPPEVLWQTDGLIAFNKPSGLAVHGPTSLDRMVQAYLVNKLPPSLSFKPGPLHRLDKPSSGIVVFSTSLEGANLFSNLMKEQKIKKSYKAIVEGTMNEKHFWTEYLFRDKEKKKTFVTETDKGKIAITMAVPLATSIFNGKPYTLIEAEIETGRTHQIRAQSSFHGHPLAQDRKYGGHAFKGGLYLHACKMEFVIDNVTHIIECPLPKEFQGVVDSVFGLS